MRKRIKLLYVVTSCKKTGPTQQLYNLISNLDRQVYDPYLVTVYAESEESLLDQFRNILPHEHINLSRKEMLIGHVKRMKSVINRINPDIIHTSGVLPDFMVTRLGFQNHVLTSRNYVYDDYVAEFGRIKGMLLARIHLYALKHTKYAVCCSKSLHDIYLTKEGILLPFIQNGVDISKYHSCEEQEKIKNREKLDLPLDKKILVYGALFNDRKNQEFLLRNIAGNKTFSRCYLLLLGDGPQYKEMLGKYGLFDNVDMRGNVTNMPEYLQAADFYISSSKSEGLPNGVLEAMASGLPVLLSDIKQHLEVLEGDLMSGFSYKSGSDEDLEYKLSLMLGEEYQLLRKHALNNVHSNFSAKIMSSNYQKLYMRICKREEERE